MKTDASSGLREIGAKLQDLASEVCRYSNEVRQGEVSERTAEEVAEFLYGIYHRTYNASGCGHNSVEWDSHSKDFKGAWIAMVRESRLYADRGILAKELNLAIERRDSAINQASVAEHELEQLRESFRMVDEDRDFLIRQKRKLQEQLDAVRAALSCERESP